jgi:hypothetical protein
VHRRTLDNKNPQSQYWGTAPYSLRSRQRRKRTLKTRILHRANDAATIAHIVTLNAHVGHMPTSAAFPTTITPQTRAQTHTTRQAQPTTTARQRHGACLQTQRTPTSHARLIAHSRTAYKHTSPARPHDVRTAVTTLRIHHCTHTDAHTPHTARHTAPTTPHCPQKITPSHTRGLRSTLTIVESGCPASTGCCRRVGCCTSTTPCRTHEQPSRHTMAPDAAADPSQPPATHRSASHSINQIKSNESQSAHCMLSLTHNTVCE